MSIRAGQSVTVFHVVVANLKQRRYLVFGRPYGYRRPAWRGPKLNRQPSTAVPNAQ